MEQDEDVGPIVLGPVPAQVVAGRGGCYWGCRAKEKTGGERERERERDLIGQWVFRVLTQFL